MTTFNKEEILRFAVTIEKNGERFYRLAAEKLQSPRVRQLFQFLAREEVGHEQLFSRLLSEVGPLEIDVRHSEDYLAYLEAYVQNVVFSNDKAEAALSGVIDEATALGFAMQREQDSILFYLELRDLVPESERPAVEAVIEEERSHYRKLAEMAKQTAETGTS